MLIRYADDLVALRHSRQQAVQVKERLASWLAPRGLTFNEDKTRIVHLSEGCNFLRFTVRHHRNPGKLLITPSRAAVRRFRARQRTEGRSLHGAPASAVISRLNPILWGWAAYYRMAVSKRVFGHIDSTMWWTMFKWGRRQHNTKTGQWIRGPLLRTVQSDQTRPLDLRPPGDRCLPAETVADARSVATRWSRPMRHQRTRP